LHFNDHVHKREIRFILLLLLWSDINYFNYTLCQPSAVAIESVPIYFLFKGKWPYICLHKNSALLEYPKYFHNKKSYALSGYLLRKTKVVDVYWINSTIF